MLEYNKRRSEFENKELTLLSDYTNELIKIETEIKNVK